jgi:hypothetical protein
VDPPDRWADWLIHGRQRGFDECQIRALAKKLRRVRDRVAGADFPLAGGPDTTTNSLLALSTARMLATIEDPLPATGHRPPLGPR